MSQNTTSDNELLTTWPYRIWLQCCDEELHEYSGDEVTWCIDKIHNFDVEYVRKDTRAFQAHPALHDTNLDLIDALLFDRAREYLIKHECMISPIKELIDLAERTVLQEAKPEADAVPMSDADIQRIFLANGFTIKLGETDLKPYVYAAARALLDHFGESDAMVSARDMDKE